MKKLSFLLLMSALLPHVVFGDADPQAVSLDLFGCRGRCYASAADLTSLVDGLTSKISASTTIKASKNLDDAWRNLRYAAGDNRSINSLLDNLTSAGKSGIHVNSPTPSLNVPPCLNSACVLAVSKYIDLISPGGPYGCWLNGIMGSNNVVTLSGTGSAKAYKIANVQNNQACYDLWTAGGGRDGFSCYTLTHANTNVPLGTAVSGANYPEAPTGCSNCGGDLNTNPYLDGGHDTAGGLYRCSSNTF